MCATCADKQRKQQHVQTEEKMLCTKGPAESLMDQQEKGDHLDRKKYLKSFIAYLSI